jgi:tRNA (cytidine/uridine-2'-O-)-methyltransferase
VINIILHCPEIPQNTGSIGRICAFAGCRLHLIHPLGFKITDKYLRRAGMDYWETLELFEYENWDKFLKSKTKPKNIYLFTTHASRTLWQTTFAKMTVCSLAMKGKGHLMKFTSGLKQTGLLFPNIKMD